MVEEIISRKKQAKQRLLTSVLKGNSSCKIIVLQRKKRKLWHGSHESRESTLYLIKAQININKLIVSLVTSTYLDGSKSITSLGKW